MNQQHSLITEGISLRAVDYGENDRILTILCPEAGVLSLFVNAVHSKKKALQGLAVAGVRAEWVLRSKRGDCWTCVEGRLLDAFPLTRQSLPCLQTSAFLLQHILETQLPGKESPLLYRLACCYLEAIHPSVPVDQLRALKASFVLKVLKHDGLLAEGSSPLADAKSMEKILSVPVNPEEFEEILLYGKRLRQD